MVVFGELGTGQTNLVTMYYGDRWRLHRKLLHLAVGLQQVRRYRDFQNDESKLVAYNLVRSPEDYVVHFERYTTSVMSIIGFGRRVADVTDPIITEVIAVMHRAADLNVPGKKFPMLLETFPSRNTIYHNLVYAEKANTPTNSPRQIADQDRALEARTRGRTWSGAKLLLCPRRGGRAQREPTAMFFEEDIRRSAPAQSEPSRSCFISGQSFWRGQ